MIRAQRRKHRRIWLILGPVLLLAFGGAVMFRQAYPDQERPQALSVPAVVPQPQAPEPTP